MLLRDDPVLQHPRHAPLHAAGLASAPDDLLQSPALVLFVGARVRPERELAELLAAAGLRCAAVSDLATAFEACGNLQFDALVVDGALLAPSLALGVAGLKPHAGCPLLVLAGAPSEVDEIVALEHGAAAFLARPLSPRLLRAHLMALLRKRAAPAEDPVTLAAAPALDVPRGSHGWLLDPMLRELRWGPHSVALTEGQFALLRCLASPAGRVVPRAELEARASGPDASLTARSIDVYVHRLRRRLAEAGFDAFEIHCVRGRGYWLRERAAPVARTLS